MSTELLTTVLKGSARLNHIRAETDQVVRMMLGLVMKLEKWDVLLNERSKIHMAIRTDSCTWRFRKNIKYAEIRCYADGPMGGEIFCYSTAPQHERTEPFWAVRWAWENLPKFLRELLVVFPELRSDVEELSRLD